MAAPYTINEGDKNLMSSVQLWMSKLQLVTAVVSLRESDRSGLWSPITSNSLFLTLHDQAAFFASTDGLLLGRVGAYVPEDTSIGNILTHATLSGALALHTSSGTKFGRFSSPMSSIGFVLAIISYLASFVLVKYSRISVPISEEASIASPIQSPYPGLDATTRTRVGSVKISQLDPSIGPQSLRQRVTAGIPDPMVTIERVYLRNFFRTKPPASLFYASTSQPETVTAPELQDAYNMLLRCNSVCVILTFTGLLLAIIGIMAYVWTTFTLTPGIFVSVCFIVSLVGACYALR